MDLNGERRRILRICLDAPIDASIENQRVVLSDLSATGAQIEHSFPLAKGRVVVLSLDSEGDRVSIVAEVMRCNLRKKSGVITYASGLRFTEPKDPAMASLRNLIADVVSRDLDARKAHMIPIRKQK